MRTCFVLLLLCLAVACKKEGLSRDTGNLEITVPGGEWTPQWTYAIYTEQQFSRFLDYQESHAIRSGFSHLGKIKETGLEKGNYGIHFYQNGTGYKRAFQLAANKVNKFTMRDPILPINKKAIVFVMQQLLFMRDKQVTKVFFPVALYKQKL